MVRPDRGFVSDFLQREIEALCSISWMKEYAVDTEQSRPMVTAPME
jgi:hypothetical protein